MSYKFETRNSKLETNTKFKCKNISFLDLELLICFVFRASDFRIL